jgi:hypothetical protein
MAVQTCLVCVCICVHCCLLPVSAVSAAEFCRCPVCCRTVNTVAPCRNVTCFVSCRAALQGTGIAKEIYLDLHESILNYLGDFAQNLIRI